MSALNFEALLKTQDFEAGIKKIQDDIRRLTSYMEKDASKIDQSFRSAAGGANELDSALKKMQAGLAAYFSVSALKSFADQVINIRGEFQKTEIAFATMLGSGEKAKSLMNDMVQLAAKTPFSLQDVSNGAKQLLAFQVPAEEVVDTLTRMGNIAAGLSVPIERINLVYGQVKAKGRLMGDDLRQFTEAGIPMVAELAKKFDTTTAAISKMVSEGKIGFNDVKDVLFSMTDEGGMFFNLMEKQSASLSGQISNLEDAWDQMLNKIGEANEGILNDAIEEITYLVEHYEGVIQVIEGLVVAYGAYRAALIVTSLSAKVAATSEASLTAVQQLSTGAKIAATEAQKALNATILANPYALAMAALAGLLYVIYNFTTQATLAEEAQERMNKRLSEAKQTTEEQKAKIESLVTAIKSENTTNEERERLLKQIHSISNGRLSQLSVEAIRTGKATAAINDYVNALDREARAKAMLDIKADNYKKIAELELKKEEYKKGNYKLTEAAGSMINTNTYMDKNGKVTGASIWAGITDKFGVQLSRIADAEIETYKKQSKKIDEWVDKNAKDVANSISKSTDTITNSVESSVEKNKEKTKNAARATQQQIAEIYPEGSIKELQQRARLIQDAIDTAVNNQVKIRKLDQYGKDKDKNGSPLYTGEVVSMEDAYKRLQEINDKIRSLQAQSLEERVNEARRQIEVRDRLLKQGYSQASVDEMFPEVKDKTFESYLVELQQRLEKISTAQAAEELIKLQDIIAEWRGDKTFVDELTEKIESLKKQFEGDELIKKLEVLRKPASFFEDDDIVRKRTEAQQNEADKLIRRAQEDEIKRQKDIYDNWLNEHKSFEEKRTKISEDAAKIRQKILDDGRLSEEQKNDKLLESQRQERNEQAELALKQLQDSEVWKALFENIDNLTAYQIDRLIEELETKNLPIVAKLLNPSDLEKVKKQLRQLKKQVGEDNPFLGILRGLNDLVDAVKTGSEDAAQTATINFEKAADAAYNTFASVKGAIKLLEPVRDYLSDTANETIDTIATIADAGMMMMEAVKKTKNAVDQAVKSVTDKAAWSNWITAIIQLIYLIIKAIVTLVTWMGKIHDKRLEKQVKRHKAEVDKLKDAYRGLESAIKDALGDETRKLQLQQIQNLREQNRELEKMRDAESKKKKKDKEKINQYNQQILDNKDRIKEMQEGIVRDILQTDAKDAADKLGDALVEAFMRGEDASEALRDKATDMIRDIAKQWVKMQLQKMIQPQLDKLLQNLGFKSDGTGEFNPLNQSQIDEFKNGIAQLSSQVQPWLDSVKDMLGTLDAEKLQGLKGDIKGVTEKTAGALEAQINAMRVNQVSGLEVMRNSLLQLSQIEANTRNLIEMRKDLKELNQKTKQGLAGL